MSGIIIVASNWVVDETSITTTLIAEPMTRRAMTPPPRAPPRFQGAARHMATNSAGYNGMSTCEE
jgi:hypothetical protein